ncbi:3-deoxy-manno-octulosonate cytidylyltransferase [Alphaproteobacteria bacterium]|nr:3-deoxy-manno-octulosonate cytidylyltransferase [Alphaproteobacteria bacterium]
MKTIGVIPAHMASVRFPKKILFNIHGLPMIEHVRRRALLSKELADVFVATCDIEIANTIKSYNGKVIMTSNNHNNGTSRVAEAVKKFDCTHILLLQGDEPLLLPRHIDKVVNAMKLNPNVDSWNATGDINSEDELNRNSFVKCTVLKDGKILNCFRKTPYTSELKTQQKFVRKILGVIGYKRDFLIKINKVSSSEIELAEFMEQMRIIENGYNLYSVAVEPSVASINEPHEADIVLNYLKNNVEQQLLLKKILEIEYK